MMMSNPSDSNVTSPKEFTITPGAPVAGAPVDDYTIQIGPSDVNNTIPASFPLSVKVPAKDLTPTATGKIIVPFPDVVSTMLNPGTYGAQAEADSGAAISGPSPLVFFNVPQPVPNPPVGFDVA